MFEIFQWVIAHKEPVLVALVGVSELLAFTKVGGIAKMAVHIISAVLSTKKKE